MRYREEIKAALARGTNQGFSHMIVAWDDFDAQGYPIYVPQGQDPRDHIPTNGDQVRECYRYTLDLDKQLAEDRAWHWEFTDASGALVFVTPSEVLRPPLDIPPAPIRPPSDGA